MYESVVKDLRGIAAGGPLAKALPQVAGAASAVKPMAAAVPKALGAGFSRIPKIASAFIDELQKLALGEKLLNQAAAARGAAARGIAPGSLGAIKQIAVKKNMLGPAAGHEQAHRVVDFLRGQPKTSSIDFVRLASILKQGMAPPLLPGMKGPNPMIRAAIGASKAAPAAALTPSKLPGGMLAGQSIAGHMPNVKVDPRSKAVASFQSIAQ